MNCRDHPTSEATETCRVCRLPYCDDCLVQVGENWFCSGCAIAVRGPPSKLAVAGVVFAVLGWLLLWWVPHVVAIGLGVSTTLQINKGQSPAAGRWPASIAVGLGSVGLVVSFLARRAGPL